MEKKKEKKIAVQEILDGQDFTVIFCKGNTRAIIREATTEGYNFPGGITVKTKELAPIRGRIAVRKPKN